MPGKLNPVIPVGPLSAERIVRVHALPPAEIERVGREILTAASLEALGL